MLAHSCVKDVSNTKITTFTISSSFNKIKLSSIINNYKKVKLNEKELNTIKSIACCLLLLLFLYELYL